MGGRPLKGGVITPRVRNRSHLRVAAYSMFGYVPRSYDQLSLICEWGAVTHHPSFGSVSGYFMEPVVPQKNAFRPFESVTDRRVPHLFRPGRFHLRVKVVYVVTLLVYYIYAVVSSI